MEDTFESYLTEVFSCVHNFPFDNGYQFRSGTGRKVSSSITNLIQEYFGFSPYEYKMSEQAMHTAVRSEILEIAEDTPSDDLEDWVDEFKRRKDNLLKKTIGAEKTTYTVVFPLNIRDSDIPSSISTPDVEYNKITYDKWRSEYKEQALNKDDTTLERFCQETPNHLDARDSLSMFYTFWEAKYDARDELFSLHVVSNQTKILVAKLNFVIYKWSAGIPQPSRNSSRPPSARWSRLQEPFFYLTFKEGDYVTYQPVDYGYRRGAVSTGRVDCEKIYEFLQLPDFSAETPSLAGVDEDIVNALLAFHEGITESSTSQSFFSFWRGMENLAQVESGQKEEAIDRAEFALNRARGKKRRPELDEAMENIRDKRNMFAHEKPNVRVTPSDHGITKLLLDGLLEFYFENYQRGFSREDYQQLLKYGAKSETERENARQRAESVIDTLNELKK
ncbi:hypothetical protein [Haladaptatus sp. T7]|uniref:hypothetical protein n=1 Tax=Haladaptatus sp. T7 TaxID=2029368 RepID=UPI0021A259B0|nr:hypothetical protein [Haladaptatus sp. T7]GKZ13372.1 hypothetical protein HAL_12530 [Haladaptatus sp. T7]